MHRLITATLWISFGIVLATTAQRVLAAGEGAQRTTTRTIRPASAAAPRTIEERMAALEKRVEDLEKGDIDQVKDEEEDEARQKRLEARLAAIEKARPAEGRPEGASPAPSASRGGGPLTVRAPFVVQNASGEAIFEVGLSPENNQPELILGDRDGARARLGVTRAGGASIALYDSANAARLAVVANPAESMFRLGGKGPAVDMSVKAAGSRLDISNNAGYGVASIESRNEHGRFTLGDPSGNTMVEAATLRSDVGVVRVGPDMGGTSGAMAGGVVVPRAIMGRKAK
jgi:hypothetical protein